MREREGEWERDEWAKATPDFGMQGLYLTLLYDKNEKPTTKACAAFYLCFMLVCMEELPNGSTQIYDFLHLAVNILIFYLQ